MRFHFLIGWRPSSSVRCHSHDDVIAAMTSSPRHLIGGFRYRVSSQSMRCNQNDNRSTRTGTRVSFSMDTQSDLIVPTLVFHLEKKVSVLIVRNGKITEKNTNLTKEANLYAMTIKSDETWYNSLNPVKHGETKTKPY